MIDIMVCESNVTEHRHGALPLGQLHPVTLSPIFWKLRMWTFHMAATKPHATVSDHTLCENRVRCLVLSPWFPWSDVATM